jgi:NTE family protein
MRLHFRSLVTPCLPLACLLLAASSAWSQAAPEPAAAASVPLTARTGEGHRPRIGLVLSGGGARGLAHVGVLKVLEAAHVPIDVIAGTSMGAIIGGLYASGMPAQDIETELLKVDWRRLFATRVSRQQLSQRRKEEDFEIANGIELGYRDGAFRAPQGAVSSRGLESLLRRYTLPVRSIDRFDQLPTPFRAVATNMETGAAVVMDHGDLAMALRSSMSVPGIFPSTDIDGMVLGDGGLVDNVPIDVARDMGADIVIVVNIGTPLAARDTLNSALGLTAQMINILTEQNVKRSLATLRGNDILIAPDLGKLSSGDFDKTAALVQLGQQGAQQQVQRLAGLALSAEAYAGWQLARRPVPQKTPELSFVRFEGTQDTNPTRFQDQLKSRVGQAFDPVTAAADANTLAASDDYVRVDYRLQSTPDGNGLVFDLEDKPWGPNYLRVGLDLSTNFSASSAFNIKVSHNRHWLGDAGTEWRNWVQIGETPSLYTEIYHPLNWNLGLSTDWFVAASAGLQRRAQTLYQDSSSTELGQVRRTESRFNVDLGRPWASLGELRLGVQPPWDAAVPSC